MRSSMLICVAAIGLFACPKNESSEERRIDGAGSQKPEGATDGAIFDVNCTGRPPQENTSNENVHGCVNKENVYDLDTKYADYAWAVFAGINERAPEQTRDSMWIDWRTWGRSDVPVAEACGLGPRGTDDSTPQLSNPLMDARGNSIRYEVRYHSEDPEENENAQRMLASVTEQLQVICARETVIQRWGRNPSRDDPDPKRPAVRLKLAWKKLSEAEQRAAGEGKFIVANPARPEEGLVAIHLAIKSATSNDWWTWATFSHVGNLTHFEGLGPFFESCEAGEQCNVCPEPGRPTPIHRVYPPSAKMVAVNEKHRNMLQKNNPLWWYELVGVQRTENARSTRHPAAGNSGPPPVYRSRFLASEVIEWDDQIEASCIGCHDKSKVWYPEPGTSAAQTAFCRACREGWGEAAEDPGTGKYVQICGGREFPINLYNSRNRSGFPKLDMFALPGRVRPPSSSPEHDGL